MEYFLVFIFGGIIGSFLNVCIYRIPLGKSIVWPRSFCPQCGKNIGWFDNIPLLSYAVLRGKCRSCKKTISFKYFLVELMCALIGVFLFSQFSMSATFFVYYFFACILIVVSFIDIKYQMIPDVFSLPGIVVGVLLFTFFRLDGSPGYTGALLNSVLGVIVGGMSMFLLGMLGEFLFKKEALGGGDIKLMAMMGAFLGWKLVILTFFLAPFFGSIIGIITKIRFGKDIIPYGPYLSIAAIISLIYGGNIINYIFVGYFSL